MGATQPPNMKVKLHLEVVELDIDFFCIGVEFVKGFHYKGTSLGFPSFECIGELENQCRDLQHEIRYQCSAFCMSMCTPESVQNLNFEVIQHPEPFEMLLYSRMRNATIC